MEVQPPNQPTNQPTNPVTKIQHNDSSLQRHIHHQLPKGPNRPMKAAIVPGHHWGIQWLPSNGTKLDQTYEYTPKKNREFYLLIDGFLISERGKQRSNKSQSEGWVASPLSYTLLAAWRWHVFTVLCDFLFTYSLADWNKTCSGTGKEKRFPHI